MNDRQNRQHPLAGQRFVLVSMGLDPDPVPSGSTGVIDAVVDLGDGSRHLNVTWDPGVNRSLNVILPHDTIRILRNGPLHDDP